MLKFKFPVIAVSNLEESIGFFEDVVGARVVESYDDYTHFDAGFAIEHDNETDDGSISLHFEESNLDDYMKYLKTLDDISYSVEELPNGQRSVLLFDPDDHAVFVTENMESAIKRMLKSGMTAEQVSNKSQYPIEYVQRFA